MSDQHQPVDMNGMIRQITADAVAAATPGIMANSLITAGNTLRGQGYTMLGNIDVKHLVTPPALLADQSSLCLLPYFRPLPGFYRLIVTHTKTGERCIVGILENENELPRTEFVTWSDEQFAELDRQLNACQMTYSGHLELGLFIVDKPVEGYPYFQTKRAEDPVVTEAAVETPVAVAAEVPVAVPEGQAVEA